MLHFIPQHVVNCFYSFLVFFVLFLAFFLCQTPLSNLMIFVSTATICCFYFPSFRKKTVYLLPYTPIVLIYILKYISMFERVQDFFLNTGSENFVFTLLSAETLITLIASVLLFCFFFFQKYRYVPMFALLCLGLILFIDYVIIENLNARFIFAETENYGNQWGIIFEMLKKFIHTPTGIFSILLLVNICLIIRYFRQSNHKIAYCYLLIVVVLSATLFFKNENYVYDSMFYNVFKVNLNNRQRVKHSEQAVLDLRKRFDLSQECIQGKNTQKNVILVIAESLSKFKIKSFGGLEDKMPLLSDLAKNSVSYVNFFGTAYNTSGGIFSILTGYPMIQDYVHLGNFAYKGYYAQTLPKRLKSKGYESLFFTSIHPKFMGDLSNMGFDYISSSEDSYYKGKQRIIYEGVADDVLLDNVITYTKNRNPTHPFLYVVSTITTHGPYIDPISKDRSFDKTLAFLDKALTDFVKHLQENRFFENGILVITSDHRAMTSTTYAEYTEYGPLANSAIPLILVGTSDEPTRISDVFSQTDITPSLEYYLTDKGCFTRFQKNLFDTKYHQNSCLIYPKLSPRDQLTIYCNRNRFENITLNGDKTKASAAEFQDFVDYVLYLRTLPMF